MKEFRLPQKFEDLENSDSDFFSVTDLIDLELCDSEECYRLLDSSNHFSVVNHRFCRRSC